MKKLIMKNFFLFPYRERIYLMFIFLSLSYVYNKKSQLKSPSCEISQGETEKSHITNPKNNGLFKK